MNALKTEYRTRDGLSVYDLDPQSSELWVVAGPDGLDLDVIDADNLPAGCRWVSAEEWEQLDYRATAARQEAERESQ